MELLNILTVLARHRLLVGLGVLLASLAGLMALYQVSLSPPQLVSRAHPFGTASARLVVDVPSTVADDSYADVEYTLAMRAILLSDLLSDDDARAAIAAKSGISADSLVVNGPAVGTPSAMTPLSELVAASERAPVEPYVVTVHTDGQIPLIAIDAVAPDGAGAKRVAAAAADTLKALAADGSTQPTHSVVVEQLGAVEAEELVDAPSRATALVFAVVTLGAWCIGLMLLSSLLRARRRARALRALQPAV